MSYWTHVRILYDIALGYPKDNKSIIDPDRGLGPLGITQLYRAALDDFNYDKGMLKLGSEGPVDITLKVEYGWSSHWYDQRIRIDDRGQLIIIGDLRDCMKYEFVEELNKFTKHLQKYGIFIISGLVRIEG